MTIKVNSDKELVKQIRQELAANDGYCPCRILHTENNKCMCKEFMDMKSGMCHCGLYIKEED